MIRIIRQLLLSRAFVFLRAIAAARVVVSLAAQRFVTKSKSETEERPKLNQTAMSKRVA